MFLNDSGAKGKDLSQDIEENQTLLSRMAELNLKKKEIYQVLKLMKKVRSINLPEALKEKKL